MAIDFKMPMLGEVMEEGRIVTWHKRIGETVEKGEIILEVETDKVVMELESPTKGVLKAILVAEGQSVPINTVLAVIE